jgi:hypothetical protein
MKTSKTDVWRELVHLLSMCPTEHLKAVACLLFYLLDDDSLDNHSLIEAIRKTRGDLDGSLERSRKSQARRVTSPSAVPRFTCSN